MIEQAAEQHLGIGKVRKRGAERLSLAHHCVELRKVGFPAFEIAAIHRVVAIGHERERQHVQLVAVEVSSVRLQQESVTISKLRFMVMPFLAGCPSAG